jgi:hypothetical protein
VIAKPAAGSGAGGKVVVADRNNAARRSRTCDPLIKSAITGEDEELE